MFSEVIDRPTARHCIENLNKMHIYCEMGVLKFLITEFCLIGVLVTVCIVFYVFQKGVICFPLLKWSMA